VSIEELFGVYDDDLEDTLEELGVLNRLKEGKAKCLVCGSVVTVNNLGAMASHEGEVVFCCDTPNCLLTLSGNVMGSKV
jgi:hypothetical protein